LPQAYSLNQDTPYHKAVQAELCAGILAEGGADMAVVMVGYEPEMKEFIRKANPGLGRRFAAVLKFEAYSKAELRTIMVNHATKNGFRLPLDVATSAAAELSKESMLQTFGNADAAAAFCEKLQKATQERAQATPGANEKAITMADFYTVTLDKNKDPFAGLIPPKGLVAEINMVAARLQLARSLGEPPPPIEHILFLGNPGTGKTTAARAVARLFKKAGVLPRDHVVERSADDLQAGYVGQTAGLVDALLKEALGGVLFIDEAHRLRPSGRGDFKSEALGKIVAAMTNPDYATKMLIIFAGYEGPMDAMLAADPGLKSRFKTRVQFEDLTPREATDALLQVLHSRGYGLCQRYVEDDVPVDSTVPVPLAFGTISAAPVSLNPSAPGPAPAATAGGKHATAPPVPPSASGGKRTPNPSFVDPEHICSLFASLAERPGWANLRDVDRLASKLFNAAATRISAAALSAVGVPGASTNATGPVGAGGGGARAAGSTARGWNRRYTKADFVSAADAFLAERPYENGRGGNSASDLAKQLRDLLNVGNDEGAGDDSLFDTGSDSATKPVMETAIDKKSEKELTLSQKMDKAGKKKAEEPEEKKSEGGKKKLTEEQKKAVFDAFNLACHEVATGWSADEVTAALAEGQPRHAEMRAIMVQRAADFTRAMAEGPGNALYDSVLAKMNGTLAKNPLVSKLPDLLGSVKEELALVAQSISESEKMEQELKDASAATQQAQARLLAAQQAALAADRLQDDEAKRKAEEERKAADEALRKAREAELELKKRSRTRMCGICHRADSPWSGCGYGGNSPSPYYVYG
jgi:hypothetical protein